MALLLLEAGNPDWGGEREPFGGGEAMRFRDYELGEYFDELFGEDGRPRASARTLIHNIEALPEGELVNRQRAAERATLDRSMRQLIALAHPDRRPDTPLAHELTVALVALRETLRPGAQEPPPARR